MRTPRFVLNVGTQTSASPGCGPRMSSEHRSLPPRLPRFVGTQIMTASLQNRSRPHSTYHGLTPEQIGGRVREPANHDPRSGEARVRVPANHESAFRGSQGPRTVEARPAFRWRQGPRSVEARPHVTCRKLIKIQPAPPRPSHAAVFVCAFGCAVFKNSNVPNCETLTHSPALRHEAFQPGRGPA